MTATTHTPTQGFAHRWTAAPDAMRCTANRKTYAGESHAMRCMRRRVPGSLFCSTHNRAAS